MDKEITISLDEYMSLLRDKDKYLELRHKYRELKYNKGIEFDKEDK